MAQRRTTGQSPTERIYREVTGRIIDRMMQGEIPWRQAWRPGKPELAAYRNPYSGTAFSFLNQVLLKEPGMYATFNQIKEHGGHVKKGCEARKVFFWSMFIPKEDKEEAERLQKEGRSADHLKQPILKEYCLFNLELDTEGLDLDRLKPTEQPETAAAEDPTDIMRMVIGDYRTNESVNIEESPQGDPSYDPETDTVTVPEKGRFQFEEDYYASLSAGLVHSTAREGRVFRKNEVEAMARGETSPREELIAEIGSSMILSACELRREETQAQSAAVCQKWIEAMKKDYRLLINAAGAAEKAARYVLNEFA